MGIWEVFLLKAYSTILSIDLVLEKKTTFCVFIELMTSSAVLSVELGALTAGHG